MIKLVPCTWHLSGPLEVWRLNLQFLCFGSVFTAKLSVSNRNNILRENMILCSYKLFYSFLIGDVSFSYINLSYIIEIWIFISWKLLYLIRKGRELIAVCLSSGVVCR